MGRTAGSPNKNKNIPTENINISVEDKYSPEDLEDIFLSNCLEQYKFFRRQAAKQRTAGINPELCEQYAEAHKLLLNRFTYVPDPVQEVEAEEL